MRLAADEPRDIVRLGHFALPRCEPRAREMALLETGVGDALDRRPTEGEAGVGEFVYEMDDRRCSDPGVAGEGEDAERG